MTEVAPSVVEAIADSPVDWWDRERGHVAIRFAGSDLFRNAITALAAGIAVVTIIAVTVNQHNILESQSKLLDRQLISQGNSIARQMTFQGELAADNAWISYRQLDEKFSRYDYGNIDYSKLNEDDRVTYHSLFERLMVAADIVSINSSEDVQWRHAFSMELMKHKNFILSDEFLRENNGLMSEYCTYRGGARTWVRYSLKSDPNASRKLAEAEQVCMTHSKEPGFE